MVASNLKSYSRENLGRVNVTTDRYGNPSAATKAQTQTLKQKITREQYEHGASFSGTPGTETTQKREVGVINQATGERVGTATFKERLMGQGIGQQPLSQMSKDYELRMDLKDAVSKNIIAAQRRDEASQSTGTSVFEGDKVYSGGQNIAGIKALQGRFPSDITGGQYGAMTSGPTRSNIPNEVNIPGLKPQKERSVVSLPGIHGKDNIIAVKQPPKAVQLALENPVISGVYEGAREFFGAPYRAGKAVSQAQIESKTKGEFFSRVAANPDVQSTALIAGTLGTGEVLGTFIYGYGALKSGEQFLMNPSVKEAAKTGFFLGLPKLSEIGTKSITKATEGTTSIVRNIAEPVRPKPSMDVSFQKSPFVLIGREGEILKPEVRVPISEEVRLARLRERMQTDILTGVQRKVTDFRDYESQMDVNRQPLLPYRPEAEKFVGQVLVSRPGQPTFRRKPEPMTPEIIRKVGETQRKVNELYFGRIGEGAMLYPSIPLEPVPGRTVPSFMIPKAKPMRATVVVERTKIPFIIDLPRVTVVNQPGRMVRLPEGGYFFAEDIFNVRRPSPKVERQSSFLFLDTRTTVNVGEVPAYLRPVNVVRRPETIKLLEFKSTGISAPTTRSSKIIDVLSFGGNKKGSYFGGRKGQAVLIEPEIVRGKRPIPETIEEEFTNLGKRNEILPSRKVGKFKFITNFKGETRTSQPRAMTPLVGKGSLIDIGKITSSKIKSDIIIGSKPKIEIAVERIPIISTISVQTPAQKQEQRQRQEQILRQEQKQEQKLRQEQRLIPSELLKKPPITPIEIPPEEKKIQFLKTKKETRKKSPGFLVFVRRKGKFTSISLPATKEAALDIGAGYVKRGLASTFKIVPTREEAKTNARTGAFSRFSSTFREFEIRKGQRRNTPLQFIEKRGTRLSTTEERRAIRSARASSNFLKGGRQKWL